MKLNEHQAHDVLSLALKHRHPSAAMVSSYDACVEDSIRLLCRMNWDDGARSALRAMRYTVGICAPVYAEAHKMVYGDSVPVGQMPLL